MRKEGSEPTHPTQMPQSPEEEHGADVRADSVAQEDPDVEAVSPPPAETRGIGDQGSGQVQEQVQSGGGAHNPQLAADRSE